MRAAGRLRDQHHGRARQGGQFEGGEGAGDRWEGREAWFRLHLRSRSPKAEVTTLCCTSEKGCAYLAEANSHFYPGARPGAEFAIVHLAGPLRQARPAVPRLSSNCPANLGLVL
jgi:hypothetical protein